MNNLDRAQKIISRLMGLGVEEFIICAGARNSPFVVVLEKNPQIKSWSFFEERSAGFFGLGRTQRTKKPVAVITTSGTAAAELLPAMIEAHFTATPLIAVTADRPRSYRESGAPQTINQIGIFSHYTNGTIDIGEADYFPEGLRWDFVSPIHFNVCFAEPLLSGTAGVCKAESLDLKRTQINKFIESADQSCCKDPLVIVSSLSFDQRDKVLQTIKNFKIPIYCEATSGLRGHSSLSEQQLLVGDEYILQNLEDKKIKSIIRIGGVPTQRFWRDLEDKFSNISVMNFTDLPYPGLARPCQTYSLEAVTQIDSQKIKNSHFEEIVQKGKVAFEKIEHLIREYPKSEIAIFRDLSELIGNNEVYVGNSLPIREWDLAAQQNFNAAVWANRGANGIDGQISTFLGLSEPGKLNFAILGDLTTLYDLAGPWISTKMKEYTITLFVVNNQGGQIFNKIFNNNSFLNSHNLSFKPLAELWGWKYLQWSKVEKEHKFEGLTLVEVRPDCTSSLKIQDDIKKLWLNQ